MVESELVKASPHGWPRRRGLRLTFFLTDMIHRGMSGRHPAPDRHHPSLLPPDRGDEAGVGRYPRPPADDRRPAGPTAAADHRVAVALPHGHAAASHRAARALRRRQAARRTAPARHSPPGRRAEARASGIQPRPPRLRIPPGPVLGPYGLEGYAGELRELVEDPEMRALLAASPQAGRLLRPLWRKGGGALRTPAARPASSRSIGSQTKAVCGPPGRRPGRAPRPPAGRRGAGRTSGSGCRAAPRRTPSGSRSPPDAPPAARISRRPTPRSRQSSST